MTAGYCLDEALVGDSVSMQRLRALIARFAPSKLPILIQGPTGSGRELVAQALHALSGRAGRLVSVNVCAVNESRFEADFFGHTRGAFTGAIGELAGYAREADGGTLFLDEIGSLAPALQPKLLRVLQEGTFRRVGASTDERADFRTRH